MVTQDAERSGSQALMPLAEARARLLDGVAPVLPIMVPPAEAIGHRLAQEHRVAADLPAVDTAFHDGWAVTADAVTGAAAHAPVYLHRAPTWVEAGAPLAPGADTILRPEAIPMPGGGAGRIAVVADAAEGEGVRRPGAELGRGLVIATAGARLTPFQALALRAGGIDGVAIRRPRIRLVAASAHAALPCTALAGFVASDGGAVTERPATGGAEAIAEALLGDGADAVFVVGGSGFGRTDRSAAGLRLAGSVTAHGLALRPGESAGFGRAAGRPVLLLPGRSDAALAAYLALGRPLVEALAGARPDELPRAPLLRKLVSTLGLSEFVFARRTAAGLEPLGGAEIPLHRLILADTAVLVPPEREGYAEGTIVEAITW